MHNLLYKHGIGAFYREPSELEHTWFLTLAGVRLFHPSGVWMVEIEVFAASPALCQTFTQLHLLLSFKTVDTSANSIVEKEVSHMNFEEQHRLAAADFEIKKKRAANTNDYQSEPISFS